MRPRLTQQVQGRDDERDLRLTTRQTPPSMRPARHGASPPCATSLYSPCCCCCCRTCPQPRKPKPPRNPPPLTRCRRPPPGWRSDEHPSELQSLMRIAYAVICLKKQISSIHI